MQSYKVTKARLKCKFLYQMLISKLYIFLIAKV